MEFEQLDEFDFIDVKVNTQMNKKWKIIMYKK